MAVKSLSRSGLQVSDATNSMLAGYPNGDFELISTAILSSTTPSVTFSNLGTVASNYKHLQVRVISRTTNSGAGNDGLWLQFNGDTAANYAWHRLEGNGSSVSSSSGTSTTWMLQGEVTRSSQAAGIFSPTIIDILDFSSTNKNKTVRKLGGSMTTANPSITLGSGFWMNTTAVTSVTLKPDSGYSFDVGSRFSIYGLRG